MKFDKSKETEEVSKDAACLRKFLAGNKTLYTKAFWENGPRRESQKKHVGSAVQLTQSPAQ